MMSTDFEDTLLSEARALEAARETERLAQIARLVNQAQSCLAPVAQAEILPGEAYVDPTVWEFEREEIFRREWLFVGHVNEVREPGSWLPFTILGEQLLLTRDTDGQVHVISAICQHRGHPLVGGVRDLPADAPCQRANKLVCPYHNWAYRLDGRLMGAPEMEHTTPVQTLRQSVRLPKLRTEIFHGLVFVNFDEDAQPLAPRLAKLDAELANYKLNTLMPGPVLFKKGLAWNWKLHHENAMEPYHTSYVHRGHHDAVPSRLTRFRTFDIGDGQIMRTTGFAKDDGDLLSGTGRREWELPDLTEEQRSRVLFCSLMPNAIVVLQPSFVTVTVMDPLNEGAMTSRRINLYPASTAAAPDFLDRCAADMEAIKVLVMEDEVTQNALQQAYRSRYLSRGRLAFLESAIAQLNQWVVDRYAQALARRRQAHAARQP